MFQIARCMVAMRGVSPSAGVYSVVSSFLSRFKRVLSLKKHKSEVLKLLRKVVRSAADLKATYWTFSIIFFLSINCFHV